MNAFILWLTVFADLLVPLLCLVLLYSGYRRRLRLRHERDRLLQEKEAALGFVHNVGEVFSDEDRIEMEHLLSRVLNYAIRTCRASAGAIHLLDPKHSTLTARAVSGVFVPPYEIDSASLTTEADSAQQLTRIVKETPVAVGQGLIGEAAVLGNSILIEDAELDSRIPRMNQPFLRIRTLVAVPMRFGNHTIGVMTLINRTTGTPFALPELNLAQAIAAQASVPVHYAGLQETLEEKRQLDRDMQIAQQIQHSLLPQTLPSLQDVEFSAFNHPAMEIGGDYYDLIEIDAHHVGLAIADVSGKGIGGALMMAVCRSVLRINAAHEYDPGAVLCSLNASLSPNLADDMFISMLYMILDRRTRTLRYARAGHEAPILIRADGTMEQVESSGTAIGLLDSDEFDALIEPHTIHLHPGDTVVTYTDGITEAMDEAGREWGMENLLASLRRMPGASAADLLQSIRNNVLQFTGKSRQSDDMTMLALRITAPVRHTEAKPELSAEAE